MSIITKTTTVLGVRKFSKLILYFFTTICFTNILCKEAKADYLEKFLGRFCNPKYGTLLVKKTKIKKKNRIPKIVLTGGTSSGKTSILLGLQRLGEHVVREAATDYIMYHHAFGGVNFPWWEKEFYCTEIVELQRTLENRVCPRAKRVFIDRGLYDNLPYLDPDIEEYQKILDMANENRYDLVFFIEQLDCFEKTAIRRENMESAKKLSQKTQKVYEDAGYDLIFIKKGPLCDRVNQVLSEVNARGIGHKDNFEQKIEINLNGLSCVLDYCDTNVFKKEYNPDNNIELKFIANKDNCFDKLFISFNSKLSDIEFVKEQ